MCVNITPFPLRCLDNFSALPLNLEMDDDTEPQVISTNEISNMETEEEEENNSASVNLIIEEGGNSSNGNSQHRAKAFILNTENNDWEEMATGICSPEPSEVKSNDSYNAIHSILII